MERVLVAKPVTRVQEERPPAVATVTAPSGGYKILSPSSGGPRRESLTAAIPVPRTIKRESNLKPTNSTSTNTVDATAEEDKSPEPVAPIEAEPEGSLRKQKSRLVGDKATGVRWEFVDAFENEELTDSSHWPASTRIHDPIDEPLFIHEPMYHGGGQVVTILGSTATPQEEGSMDALLPAIAHEDVMSRPVPDINRIDTSEPAEPSSSGMSSYWLSRVYPLRHAQETKKEKELPPEPVSPAPVDDSREKDLIALIHTMIHSQNESVAGTQAMMLTLIESLQQKRPATPPPQPPTIIVDVKKEEASGPTAADIAVALSGAIKDMMETMKASSLPPAPIIVEAPKLASLPVSTVTVLKDEEVQVSAASFENEPEEVVNMAKIRGIVHEGIVDGVRDILDIICPSGDLPGHDDHEGVKKSIRGHVETLDQLERLARRSSHKVKPVIQSRGPVELPQGLLVIDQARIAENLIEQEIEASERRMKTLRSSHPRQAFHDDKEAVERTRPE